MRISVFGMGYVGVVSAGCLAGEGHHIVGVDPNADKVGLINRGIAPIVETEIDVLVATAHRESRLRATADAREAVASTELSLVCVGTPSQLNGNLDLSYVRRVCEDIGTALAQKAEFHVVVIRSTMLPGSMREVVIPTLEAASGKRVGVDFGVCNNPEFLREGTAVWDYRHPPKTVIGETDRRAGDVLMGLYAQLDAPVVRTSVETAEMVKYADNAWHALKVSFANEIGALSKALGLDGQEVMRIFCEDKKLNLSAYYLRPGFAFGGSCLPKDVRALEYRARALDVKTPVLESIIPSNQLQIRRAVQLIQAPGRRKIGVLGFAFKAGTDDLRESAMVDAIELLIGKGYELKLYDENVNLAALTGANRDYILNHIPHIARVMVKTVQEVLDFAEVVVIGHAAPELRAAVGQLRPGQVLVDLVRVREGKSEGDYQGICW